MASTFSCRGEGQRRGEQTLTGLTGGNPTRQSAGFVHEGRAAQEADTRLTPAAASATARGGRRPQSAWLDLPAPPHHPPQPPAHPHTYLGLLARRLQHTLRHPLLQACRRHRHPGGQLCRVVCQPGQDVGARHAGRDEHQRLPHVQRLEQVLQEGGAAVGGERLPASHAVA